MFSHMRPIRKVGQFHRNLEIEAPIPWTIKSAIWSTCRVRRKHERRQWKAVHRNCTSLPTMAEVDLYRPIKRIRQACVNCRHDFIQWDVRLGWD